MDELVLLAKIRRSLPDTFHGLKDTELRYRQRYVDLLMSEETREAFVDEGTDRLGHPPLPRR